MKSAQKLIQSRIHFIGIGGSGMNGLAELMFNMGATVTGSDLALNAQVARLQELGIKVSVGHSASHITNQDVVVYSSAVAFDNPEIIEAKRIGIPIIPRIEILAEVMRLKRGIAVGGTHGKTTTTAMTASILLNLGLDPTVVVGGRLDLIKSHSFLGKGEWIVAESDESDGSFLKLSPEIAIITNIDNDHLDFYGSMDNLKKAYLDFAKLVPFYGCVIACGDQKEVREVFSQFNKRVIFYGFGNSNDFVIRDKSLVKSATQFNMGEIKLGVAGKHNLLNATAAILASMQVGVTFTDAQTGLQKFKGVDRRLQYKGESNSVLIYDDYGHHPTEVRATLQALRELYPNKKIVVAFQPHRYSRTQICWNDFLNAFDVADKVLLYDIYAAGEKPLPQISSERLAQNIVHKDIHYVGSGEAAAVQVKQSINPGEILLTLGAGDISKLGPKLMDMQD